jgi:hypothetical protein
MGKRSETACPYGVHVLTRKCLCSVVRAVLLHLLTHGYAHVGSIGEHALLITVGVSMQLFFMKVAILRLRRGMSTRSERDAAIPPLFVTIVILLSLLGNFPRNENILMQLT